jgi:hypothetical protein
MSSAPETEDRIYLDLQFNVPVGTYIREMDLSAQVGNSTEGEFPSLQILGAREEMNVTTRAIFASTKNWFLRTTETRRSWRAVTFAEAPDASRIVVESLTDTHDGTQIPFPMLQPGDKETLIAEWNEYTPSSGIDIAVTTNLATIV